jgi:hypothetical protein
MALKPWTMSFKETNLEEVLLHEILGKKTSPMAFAKDILIEVLVRGNNVSSLGAKQSEKNNNNECRGEIEDIFEIK